LTALDEAPVAVEDAGLHEDVRAFLDANWDPELSVRDWWSVAGAAGWSAPHFPTEWGGRGYSRRSPLAVRAAFDEVGALHTPGGLGLLMAAPTILTHGTPEQRERYVPDVYNGAVAWCQLFSEPGSGSDLAGLTTRAVRDGDHWIISGQKVWSSMAREADFGMLLARTNPEAPKHAGISWFAFALDQPGVTIRPLQEITGHSMFNEVFFDDAVVADADLVGGLNNGWAVANTTLLFERSGIGVGGTMAGFPPPGPKGGFLELRAGDAATRKPPPSTGTVLTLPELFALARSTGHFDDPVVRQKLARLVTYVRSGEWTAKRGQVEMARGGGVGLPNLGKLAQTRIMKLSAEIACDVLGPDAFLWGTDGPASGRYAEALVFSAASSIYGGTDEIQRNVIGERALGLPREPDPNKGLPFREVLERIHGAAGASANASAGRES
jgi:alkylation response protein AidB-like acyl-CoA dehydrogenase